MPLSAADTAREFESRHEAQTAIRYVKATALARLAGFGESGMQAFERLYPRATHLDALRRALDVQHRAAVPAGSSETWMAPFTGPRVFLDAFAAQVRRKAVLGQIPGAIRVDPATRSPFPTGPATAAWVGMGAAIPVSRGAFADLTLTPLLLAGIVVATNEMLRATGPSGEDAFEGLLTNAAISAADTALLDPAQAGEPEVSPPSITHGAFTTPSTGATVAALNADLGLIVDNMEANGVIITAPVVILSAASGLRLGALTLPGSDGQSPKVTVLPSPAAGSNVILLEGSYFAYCDGGLDVTLSGSATLEMSDAPTADADAPAGPTGPLVSLWQTNSTGFRLSQYLNWALANPAAVGVVTGFGSATP